MQIAIRALTTVLITSLVCGGATAQTLLRTHPLTRGGLHAATPAPLATPAGDHTIFGQITRLGTATTFVMRLRSGRSINVDASSAVATGRYSAPLFTGKFIVVTGALAQNGTLLAQSVTRMEHIDGSTRADR